MSERLRVLRSDLQAEREHIRRIYKALRETPDDLRDPKEAIAAGYSLHNLYNVCENSFRRIAEVFENEIPDPTRWHALLLERMGREIEGIRPLVLREDAFRLEPLLEADLQEFLDFLSRMSAEAS